MSNLDNLMRDLREVICPATSGEEAAHGTCEVLKRYAREAMDLPERLCAGASPCYARHLVYQQENDGYCVVAMVWGPGQGTAVHDHGGVWCVEGCVRGKLEITSYRMLDESSPEKVKMQRETVVQVSQGSVGCLIPPFEHHKIHNPFEETAITLHVYGKELNNCTRFLEAGQDLYRKEKVPLSYTSRPQTVTH